jgi:hypothetical protein
MDASAALAVSASADDASLPLPTSPTGNADDPCSAMPDNASPLDSISSSLRFRLDDSDRAESDSSPAGISVEALSSDGADASATAPTMLPVAASEAAAVAFTVSSPLAPALVLLDSVLPVTISFSTTRDSAEAEADADEIGIGAVAAAATAPAAAIGKAVLILLDDDLAADGRLRFAGGSAALRPADDAAEDEEDGDTDAVTDASFDGDSSTPLATAGADATAAAADGAVAAAVVAAGALGCRLRDCDCDLGADAPCPACPAPPPAAAASPCPCISRPMSTSRLWCDTRKKAH